MNKSRLLKLLIKDAEKNADDYYGNFYKRSLEEALEELNTRQPVDLPPKLLQQSSRRIVTALRKHFKDDVTFISFILNHYFPEQYLFYRVSKLEEEIFTGLEFFAEVAPELDFPFRKIGKKGFDHYLALNEGLLEFAHGKWPRLKKPNNRLMYFLYEGLGQMFLEKSDYRRYWVMMSKPSSFEHLKGRGITWSARKDMQAGDLVFMYRAAPHSAITEIYQTTAEPYFEPGGGWDGFWVDLEKVCEIKPIPIAEMRASPTINSWSSLRRNFIGLVTDPVPHSVYNGLLAQIPSSVRKKYKLNQEPVAETGTSGQFASEKDFEEAIIVPLLKKWAFRFQREHLCYFQVGGQRYPTRVDFLVSDGHGLLTLFENKQRILNNGKDLSAAIEQAKSYALQLGLLSFVVASPEGLWLYALDRNEATLKTHLTLQMLQDQRQEEAFRETLLKVRF